MRQLRETYILSKCSHTIDLLLKEATLIDSVSTFGVMIPALSSRYFCVILALFLIRFESFCVILRHHSVSGRHFLKIAARRPHAERLFGFPP